MPAKSAGLESFRLAGSDAPELAARLRAVETLRFFLVDGQRFIASCAVAGNAAAKRAAANNAPSGSVLQNTRVFTALPSPYTGKPRCVYKNS